MVSHSIAAIGSIDILDLLNGLLLWNDEDNDRDARLLTILLETGVKGAESYSLRIAWRLRVHEGQSNFDAFVIPTCS